ADILAPIVGKRGSHAPGAHGLKYRRHLARLVEVIPAPDRGEHRLRRHGPARRAISMMGQAEVTATVPDQPGPAREGAGSERHSRGSGYEDFGVPNGKLGSTKSGSRDDDGGGRVGLGWAARASGRAEVGSRAK
ncbi:hypothetical protein THAOC_18000, partial [Thalassiosira oceanica]